MPTAPKTEVLDLRAAVSSLSNAADRTALLDENGRIAAINPAWREAARRTGESMAELGRGALFLAQCERAAGQGDTDAAALVDALRRVMAREATSVTRTILGEAAIGAGASSVTATRVQGPLENWYLVSYSGARPGAQVPVVMPELGLTLGSGLSHGDVMRVMDAVPGHVALLDTSGKIFAVNTAWRRFAAAEGASEAATGCGADYLAVCEAAVRAGDRRGAQFADGLRAVLSGKRRSWWLDSRVNVRGEVRLFRGRVTRVESPDGPFVIVAHTDLSTPNVAANAA